MAMNRVIASEHVAKEIEFSRQINIPISAALLAGAATLCLLGSLPVWAALVGWAAYHTRGSTLRDGAYNLACAVTGLGFGIVTQFVALKLDPSLGIMALPAALFLAAIGIQLMKWITGENNIPSYFIGVAVVFAAAMNTSLDTYLTLTATVSVGAFAAALADFVHRKRTARIEG